MSALRVLYRLPGFLLLAGIATVHLFLFARPTTPARRAHWLHRWIRLASRLLGIHVHAHGIVPTRGLVLSNHLGYVDIFVLASLCPMVFVSRADVSGWPLAGALTRWAGTIFIDRSRITDVRRVSDELAPVVESGQLAAVFLEGRSTGGEQVLPFRSSLLGPAIEHGWSLTPAYLRYACPDADPAQAVAYWGDMVFFPHFLRFLGLRRIEAHVSFGESVVAKDAVTKNDSEQRRVLGDRLRAAVCALGAAPPTDAHT